MKFTFESRHLLAPLIQYLPQNIQHRIARWAPRGLLQPGVVHQIVDKGRLPTLRERRQLFPDRCILKERVLGVTKSDIAVCSQPAAESNPVTRI